MTQAPFPGWQIYSKIEILREMYGILKELRFFGGGETSFARSNVEQRKNNISISFRILLFIRNIYLNVCIMSCPLLRELPPLISRDIRHKPLQFELVEETELLQYSLASSVNAIAGAWRLATSFLGLIPQNSVRDKFPFYRQAVVSSAPGPLPRDLNWVLRTQRSRAIAAAQAVQEAEAADPVAVPLPPSTSIPRPTSVRRGCRSYPRDGLTHPKTILIYNIVLALAMFQIDVGASSF